MKTTVSTGCEVLLQRVQIREQILDVLRIERLAVARHFITTEPDDIGDALVVGGQAAQGKIFVLEHSLQSRAFLAAGGIWLMAAVAAVVVNSASGGLLRVEAEFSVGLAGLDVAREDRNQSQQSNHRSEKESLATSPHEMTHPSKIVQFHEPSLDRAIRGAASRFTIIRQSAMKPTP